MFKISQISVPTIVESQKRKYTILTRGRNSSHKILKLFETQNGVLLNACKIYNVDDSE